MNEFFQNSLFFGAAISLLAYEAALLLKKKFPFGHLKSLAYLCNCRDCHQSHFTCGL